ncbi:uncharacterized protein LOC135091811 [Scylla paramamosain]|uniref:uncharacterized protein LOC135091811 n=1 Tax=Scylla paramamosain TaxID=85552 RepID=UPI0030836831
MRLLTLALLLVAGTVKADFDDEVDLQQHLDKLSNPRYPIESNTNNRGVVRDYIIERMKYYGLEVKTQKFNTTINKDPLGINSDRIEVQGTNVIGIQRAVTEHPGAVVVVGADYDSNGVDHPLFYNGAGVATLLEVARMYSVNERWSGHYVANYTTIFVAFDINTKLHQDSPGRPGGYYFVQNWLMPFLKQKEYFGGAIILDSVMNVNYKDNSQILSSNFQNIFPDTYKRLQNDNNKGNFLAMVSNGDKEPTKILREQFSGSYYKDRRSQPFRLEDMKLSSGVKFDNLLEQFTKSDNIHFWNAKDFNGEPIQLPALLLTDTKNSRTLSTTNCITDPCRPVELVTEERTEFVEATVKGVTTFLFNRQATRLPYEPSSSMSSLPSAIMTVLMLALVRLYM